MRYPDWPKRYCLWRLDAPKEEYENWFDTLNECLLFQLNHPDERIEFEDNLGKGGNAAKGIWLFNM